MMAPDHLGLGSATVVSGGADTKRRDRAEDDSDVDLGTLGGVVTLLGRLRSRLGLCGGLAMVAATAQDAAERRRAQVHLSENATACHRQASALDPHMRDTGTACRSAREDLARTLQHAAMNGEAPTLDAAQEFVWAVTDHAVPAVQQIMTVLITREWARMAQREAALAQRTASVAAMCDEMDRIGRTVRMISINAAVEAARSGGETGRVFGLIAENVRELSTRASDVVRHTREQLRQEDDD
ncbi:methyl-accepting chemotaxis protein [Jannaschia sp. M317]|uniref:methyl-accepting chemotaxis protein n=1 Tax=Jannaschia sp. M317 TaxID=2867011 RepID=UPI0021A95F69|nr:methyl-accepting chemotaxis protein [Jannaschia sp. M317]UWQ18577.1 hypothetical protein K3551_04595 [Jannaschia sp. M317]